MQCCWAGILGGSSISIFLHLLGTLPLLCPAKSDQCLLWTCFTCPLPFTNAHNSWATASAQGCFPLHESLSQLKGTSAKYSFKGTIRKPLTHGWADKPWEDFLARTKIPSLVSCQLKLLPAIIAHESLIQLCVVAARVHLACLSHCGFLLLSIKWLLYHLAIHCISLKTALEPSISKCLQSCPFFFLSLSLFFFKTSELFLSWTECWIL